MATALMRAWDASGNLTFDTTLAQVGALAETFAANYDGSGTPVVKTYPSFPGRSATAFQISGAGVVTATVDTSLGYPRVTATKGYPGYTTYYAVFIS